MSGAQSAPGTMLQTIGRFLPRDRRMPLDPQVASPASVLHIPPRAAA